jgi:hypothetical protein
MKTTVSSEADEINSMPDGVARRNGPTERPRYLVGQTGTWAGVQRRVDGRPSGADGCPTEGAWVPNRGRMGARRRVGLGGWPNGGSRGWPDGGVYKSGWPTFLGTLL